MGIKLMKKAYPFQIVVVIGKGLVNGMEVVLKWGLLGWLIFILQFITLITTLTSLTSFLYILIFIIIISLSIMHCPTTRLIVPICKYDTPYVRQDEK